MTETEIDEGIERMTKIYEKKEQQFKAFLEAKEKYREAKSKMGAWNMLENLPHPLGVITGLILLYVFFDVVRKLPLIWYALIENYNLSAPLVVNTFIFSAILNIILIVFIMLTILFSGRMVLVWMKAAIMRRPILALNTKNRTKEFIIPKKVTYSMWDIDDDNAVLVDPEAIFMGPNKVSIMEGVPELGVGVNVRNLIKGMPINVDMSSVKMYAKAYENRAREAMRTGSDAIAKFFPWMIILVIIGLIFYPLADRRMDQTNVIQGMQNDIVQCKMTLAENGILPPGTPPVEGGDRVRPASTGVKLK